MSNQHTHTCPDCGATYTAPEDSCAARFDTLLARDHSRQEPWGSRHGRAFAAFVLQHPTRYPDSLDHAWTALCRIYLAGDDPTQVFGSLRRHPDRLDFLGPVPIRPETATARPAITIADLGAFPAALYPQQLDSWCRATLAAWGGPPVDSTPA